MNDTEKLNEAADSGLLQPRLVRHLSPFADRMLQALQRLTNEREEHQCGGFTTDDMQWTMGVAFTPKEELHAALDELTESGLVRYAGDDEEDAIGLCYELLPNSASATPSCISKPGSAGK